MRTTHFSLFFILCLFLLIFNCKKEDHKTAPSISIDKIDSITSSGVKIKAGMTDKGGLEVIEYGICWSTHQNPTTADSKISNITDPEDFKVIVSGLNPATTYYVRGYAINTMGTGYSTELTFKTMALVPELNTLSITEITTVSANGGGKIISDGGASITARGLCWSTNRNPSLNDSKLSPVLPQDSFRVALSGLTPATKYYVRAYAANEAGTGYGVQDSFKTMALVPLLNANVVDAITASSANSSTTILSDGGAPVTESGICWSTNANPTLADHKILNPSGLNSFTLPISGLAPGTTYYVRSYATNSSGIGYSAQATFKTPAVVAVLNTADVTAIAATTAGAGGSITFDGGGSITDRGICWGLTDNPTVLDNKIPAASGLLSFTVRMTGLTPGKTYNVRAYAVNEAGTGYGNTINFKTIATVPQLDTLIVSAITSESANTSSSVRFDGGAALTESGICWSINQNPTVSDHKIQNLSGLNSFSLPISGLSPGTIYYVRSYAINEKGAGYSSQISFKTLVALPVLNTIPVTSISTKTATAGGTIISIGGGNITEKGFCWSTNQNPTIADHKVLSSSGTDAFTVNLSGIAPSTTYYLRSYATNEAGTSYGSQVSFVTQPAVLATIANGLTSMINTTSAAITGIITSDGGGNISESGFCWSLNQNPGISDNKVINTTGENNFNIPLTGIAPATTYYVRIFAINEAGISYNDQLSFTTLPLGLPVVTTTAVSGITSSSAVTGGNVTSSGAIIDRGVCWNSTQESPKITDNKVSAGTDLNNFTINLSGLTEHTIIWLRAYATNSSGTSYGDVINFNTSLVKSDNGPVFNPNLTYGTLTDVDGNVYKTIQIGGQTWMAENLKTTKFRNGDPIPNVTSTSSWAALTTGAYCWYNNSAANKSNYGALYNFYAIADNRNIAPEGWHVATKDDWTNLANVYGGTGFFKTTGGSLKENDIVHWYGPNLGANNESGFTALPGGERLNGGSFSSLEFGGSWYSATESDTQNAWYFWMLSISSNAYLSPLPKTTGFSVRCVKD